MAVSERDRRILHQSLAAQIGEREADTLMEHLPPTGYADLVTKADLDSRIGMLEVKMDALEARLTAGFHRDLVRQTWIFVGAMLTGLGTLAGVLHP